MLAILLQIASLYLPGYLLLKAANFHDVPSICFAPVVSLAMWFVLTTIYAPLGIYCSSKTLVLPCLIAGIAAYVIRHFYSLKHPKEELLVPSSNGKYFNLLTMLLYLVVGVSLTSWLFVSNLSSIDAFSLMFDNASHMASVRMYAESGNWSTLWASDNISRLGAEAYSHGMVFYPSGFYWFAAVPVSMFNISVPLGINASLFSSIAVVFPLSIFCLLRYTFPENKYAVISGAIVCFIMPSFPWYFLCFGPLYPNLFGLSLCPLLLSLFVILGDKLLKKEHAIYIIPVIICAFIACGIVHPNAVFTAFLLLIPYGLYISYKIFNKWQAPVITFVLLFIVWTLICLAPFMSGAMHQTWYNGLAKDAIIRSALLVFHCPGQMIPFILIALTIVGVVQSVRSKHLTWILASFICAVIVFVGSYCTEHLYIQHFLAGFWYTDAYRTAATCVFPVILLASLGLGFLIQKVATRSNALAVGVAALSACILFFPLQTPAQSNNMAATKFVGESVKDMYDMKNYLELPQKREFIEQVEDYIKEEKVFNNPFDGSSFAYGGYGLNSYFPQNTFDDTYDQNSDSQYLKKHLNEISTDKRIQQIVKDSGVRYVLKLNKNNDEKAFFFRYLSDYWTGIQSINESTPGFKLVLDDGSKCALYEIVLD